jgi:hypothetical protein
MTTIYVLRAFGGVLIIQSVQAPSATVLVAARTRDGIVQAQTHDGIAPARTRDGTTPARTP